MVALNDVDSLINNLLRDIDEGASSQEIQEDFIKARIAYKHIEYLVEYTTPDLALLINGPPVHEAENEDNLLSIKSPEGFQTIELFLFPAYNRQYKDSIHVLATTMQHVLQIQKERITELPISDSLLFRAVRLQIIRVTTLSLAAYDAELSGNCLHECGAVFQSVKNILDVYKLKLGNRFRADYEQCNNLLTDAVNLLNDNTNPDRFDRLYFIITYANPIAIAWYKIAQDLSIDLSSYKTPVFSNAASSIFDIDAIDVRGFIADESEWPTNTREQLGKLLFNDPILSGNKKRSCSFCHQPEKAFTDGLNRSYAIDGKHKVKRNAPTLINSSLQPALFYDGRVTYLEDQITEVLTNPDEMHGTTDQILEDLKKDSGYITLFRKAFPVGNEPITTYHLQNALASYVRSLNALNTPFDKYMRGEHSQLSEVEIKGFNIFMGKARCATCHFVPLFNGALPPLFQKAEAEVIGVFEEPGKAIIDPDKGIYQKIPASPNLYSFRVPSLRNISLTAPYMHNGNYTSLEQVIDFYNDGGGTQLKETLDNLTLPNRKLNLAQNEKVALIAFLKKLTDTTIHKR